MSLKEIIVAKATSGKYFLTVCAGLVFMYTSYRGILPKEAIVSIITSVFTMYFLKKDEHTNGGVK